MPSDPERLARFEREAKTLASLNHPHIAQIYGFEQSGEIAALVMELVEGDDLSVRIARGPLPLDDALAIARQIAEALEAAHEQGIIHRDLKPANIKLRADGVVKVLDFGLAKALEPGSGIGDAGSPNLANSPTITSPAMTVRGMILGTAAYMAPEQAKGKPVDRRTDIWAFGCVLYEMLAGRRAFASDDVSTTLAAVLLKDPEWHALPASTPVGLRRLLTRCLTKDPRTRLRDIGEARVRIDELLSGAPDDVAASVITPAPLGWRRLIPWFAAGALGLAAMLMAGALALRPVGEGAPAPVTRFLVTLPEGRAVGLSGRVVALSPSGNELAYLSDSQLLLRRFSDFEMAPVAAEDLGFNLQSPVFSPDGKWIAFYSASRRIVRRISVQGGAVLDVCEASEVGSGESVAIAGLGLDWHPSGIVVAGAGGVVRCNPAGGTPEPLVKVENGETVLAPQMLPAGDALLFTIAKLTGGPARWDQARVVVQSLRTGERQTVLEGGSNARFVSTGHLIYAVGGVVFAAPFDLATRQLRGVAVPIVEGVRRGTSGAMQFAVSDSGALVYLSGPSGNPQALRHLAIGDRTGKVTEVPVSPAAYSQVRVSPDGTRAALGVDDGRQANVLVYALSGASAVQRLTGEGGNRFPVWSPDGLWIAFQSDRAGDRGIFRQRADGSGVAERLTTAAPGEQHVPESWSPDGRHLSFGAGPADGLGSALWMLTLSDRTTTAFGGVSSTGPIGSAFSPDGKWLAYGIATASDVANVNRGVFLQPFPATGAKYQVPRQIVDFHPVWSRSGSGELVFSVAATAGLMAAVRVTTAGGVTFGTPLRFPASVGGDRVASEPRAWDILPDGRFIGIASTTDDAVRGSMRVVLNWFEELKQRVPVP